PLPAGTNLGDGNDHTLVVVYDGAQTLTAYVDGVAGAPVTIAPLDTQPGQVLLGQTLYGAQSAGDEIRHFAIFPTALTASDVATLHAALAGAVPGDAFTQPVNGTVVQVGDQ